MLALLLILYFSVSVFVVGCMALVIVWNLMLDEPPRSSLLRLVGSALALGLLWPIGVPYVLRHAWN